jgi:prepilin-type N-terminal cleavage/methylation domain-containing protein
MRCTAAHPQTPHAWRGFSLIELLLVLGITALIAILAFVIYPMVQSSVQARSETDRYLGLAANLSSSMGVLHNYQAFGQGYPGSASNNTLGSTFVRSLWSNGSGSPTGTTVNNMWGGSVSLVAYRDMEILNKPTGSVWLIQDNNVPPQVCPKLLANLSSPGNPFVAIGIMQTGTSQFTWFQIKNQAAAQAMGYTKNMSTPNMDDVLGVCDFMGSNGNNIGILVFGE